jgi:hypothetical protein
MSDPESRLGISQTNLLLLDFDVTPWAHSARTSMRRPMSNHSPLYLVAVAAALMMLLASIGLFTDFLGVPQLLVVARVMVSAIVLIAVVLACWHR